MDFQGKALWLTKQSTTHSHNYCLDDIGIWIYSYWGKKNFNVIYHRFQTNDGSDIGALDKIIQQQSSMLKVKHYVEIPTWYSDIREKMSILVM